MFLFTGLLFNISQYGHILVYTKHYYLTFFRHILLNDVYHVFDTFANRSCILPARLPCSDRFAINSIIFMGYIRSMNLYFHL